MTCYANAREFLLAVEARYRTLSEYSDQGWVRTYMRPPRKAELMRAQRSPGFPASAKMGFESRVQRYRESLKRLRGRPLSEVPFETAYRSPDRFRFGWIDRHSFPPLHHLKTQHVIGCDSAGPYGHVRRHNGVERLERDRSLPMTIAGATGISHGAAHTIGALLFEQCGGRRLRDMQRPRFRGTRVIDGVDYIAVAGFNRGGERVTAWFGVDDLMLRRVLEKRSRHEERRLAVKTAGLDPSFNFDAPAGAAAAA